MQMMCDPPVAPTPNATAQENHEPKKKRSKPGKSGKEDKTGKPSKAPRVPAGMPRSEAPTEAAAGRALPNRKARGRPSKKFGDSNSDAEKEWKDLSDSDSM